VFNGTSTERIFAEKFGSSDLSVEIAGAVVRISTKSNLQRLDSFRYALLFNPKSSRKRIETTALPELA